jgi:hypothetical protein
MDFFLANIGVVVTAKQLQEVAAPVSEWARRVRELREDEGWRILSHNDSADLKPGEYLLEIKPSVSGPKSARRNMSQRLRAAVLDRDGFTCQMCGKTAGDTDDETGRKVRLHIGHIIDKSLRGKDELSNLRTLCSTCNQGAKNVTVEKPTELWLLTQVRRAGIREQRAVFEWLTRKFNDAPPHEQ